MHASFKNNTCSLTSKEKCICSLRDSLHQKKKYTDSCLHYYQGVIYNCIVCMFSCFQYVYFCAFSKKISTFSRSGDWSHAQNYVAKRYIEAVDRDVYFQDVHLQMDAKVWGEEYNRHNPPKKVESEFLCWLKFSFAPGWNLPVVIDKKYHIHFFFKRCFSFGAIRKVVWSTLRY